MIRLTARQFRASAVTVYAALAALAVLLSVTGPRLAHFYDSHIAGCRTTANQCTGALLTFLSFYHAVQASLGPILLALPVLIGIFWGAPLLAHELETGTYRLAWTQSVSRRRWLAVKLGAGGVAAMAAAGLLSLMVTWWFSPIDRVNANWFTPAMFGERGIVPIGYAAFAFAFGVAAGMLIRRTVPAMVTTLVAFLGARVGMTYLLRPHLMPPVRLFSTALDTTVTGPMPPGMGTPSPADWVLSAHTVNAAGQDLGNLDFNFQQGPGGVWLQGVGRCPNMPAAPRSAGRCTVPSLSRPASAGSASGRSSSTSRSAGSGPSRASSWRSSWPQPWLWPGFVSGGCAASPDTVRHRLAARRLAVGRVTSRIQMLSGVSRTRFTELLSDKDVRMARTRPAPSPEPSWVPGLSG